VRRMLWRGTCWTCLHLRCADTFSPAESLLCILLMRPVYAGYVCPHRKEDEAQTGPKPLSPEEDKTCSRRLAETYLAVPFKNFT